MILIFISVMAIITAVTIGAPSPVRFIVDTDCSIHNAVPASIHSPSDNLEAVIALNVKNVNLAQLDGFDYKHMGIKWNDKSAVDYLPIGFNAFKSQGFLMLTINGQWTVSPTSIPMKLCKLSSIMPPPDFTTFITVPQCLAYHLPLASIHSPFQNIKAIISVVFTNEVIALLGGYYNGSAVVWQDGTPTDYVPPNFKSSISGNITININGLWGIADKPIPLQVCEISWNPFPSTTNAPSIQSSGKSAVIAIGVVLAVVVVGSAVYVFFVFTRSPGGSTVSGAADYGIAPA